MIEAGGAATVQSCGRHWRHGSRPPAPRSTTPPSWTPTRSSRSSGCAGRPAGRGRQVRHHPADRQRTRRGSCGARLKRAAMQQSSFHSRCTPSRVSHGSPPVQPRSPAMLLENDEVGMQTFCETLHPATVAEALADDLDVEEVWRVLRMLEHRDAGRHLRVLPARVAGEDGRGHRPAADGPADRGDVARRPGRPAPPAAAAGRREPAAPGR